MAIEKECDREGLRDRVTKSFIEYTILWVSLMVISGVLLIVGGYCVQQTRYIFWAPSFISIGSSLIAIGLVTIAFKAASVRLFTEEMVKKTAKTTIEEMEHTFIPKMIAKGGKASIKIVPSENNPNTPKMKICEEKTLRNLHDTAICQRKVKVDLHEGQMFELINIEVGILKSKKFNPTPSVKTSQIIPSDPTKEKTEIYEYIIPFTSSLNKGEDVSIKEEYEWSPCKATPGTDQYDEFAYKLDFPTEKLVIEMIAEGNFYFTILEKKVIDWSGKEINVQSAPVVITEINGLIREAKWSLPLTDLTHFNTYEIRFRLGIM